MPVFTGMTLQNNPQPIKEHSFAYQRCAIFLWHSVMKTMLDVG